MFAHQARKANKSRDFSQKSPTLEFPLFLFPATRFFSPPTATSSLRSPHCSLLSQLTFDRKRKRERKVEKRKKRVRENDKTWITLTLSKWSPLVRRWSNSVWTTMDKRWKLFNRARYFQPPQQWQKPREDRLQADQESKFYPMMMNG